MAYSGLVIALSHIKPCVFIQTWRIYLKFYFLQQKKKKSSSLCLSFICLRYEWLYELLYEWRFVMNYERLNKQRSD